MTDRVDDMAVREHGPVCECCEKRTLEPIYHGETGDAFCGTCAVELLGAEVKVLRGALEELTQRHDVDYNGEYVKRDVPVYGLAALRVAEKALELT